MKIKPLWIAAGIAAALGFVAVSQDGPASGTPEIRVERADDGTWRFAIWSAGNLLVVGGPFASATAANAAADAWLAGQGAAQPPVIPPIPTAPYLQATSGSVSASAFARTDGVTWRITGGPGGPQNGAAANALIAGRDMLTAMDIAATGGQPITIELRRANGAIARARVERLHHPPLDWTWTTFTPPAVEGGVASSSTRPEWRSPTRLGALRGALSTLQGS